MDAPSVQSYIYLLLRRQRYVHGTTQEATPQLPHRQAFLETVVMEPSTTPPSADITTSLSGFHVIGHNTTLWTSQSYLSESPVKTPLILIFSWNAAAEKHIVKYTIAYQKLFPTASILLIRCFTRDLFRWRAEYASLLKPAMDLVNSHVTAGGEVLVHSFSNGGGNQVNELAKAWTQRFGGKMPMRVHVFDSSPSKGSWMRSHAAIAASLPKTLLWRWFGGAMLHLVLFFTMILDVVLHREKKMAVLCRELNNEDVFDNTVPRVYVYSRADEIVTFEDVEEHADIAESKGWDVTRVHFSNSAHCGHVREDEAKYWATIMEAWRKGPRQS